MPKSWKTLFFSQIILISVLSLSLSYANASTNQSLTSYIVNGTITTLGCHIMNGNITNQTTLMGPIQICHYKNSYFQIKELPLGGGCIQVIAHWKDPDSGHVYTFPNPCVAPQFLNPSLRNVTGTEPIPSGRPSIDSPLKQFKSGIAANDVKCQQDLQLVIKSEDGSPACVKPQTAQKLVEHGWGWAMQPTDSLKPLQSKRVPGLENDTGVVTLGNQIYYFETPNYTHTAYYNPVQISFHDVVFTLFPPGFSGGLPTSVGCGSGTVGELVVGGGSYYWTDAKFSDGTHELLHIFADSRPCPVHPTPTYFSTHTNPQAGLTFYEGKMKLLVSTDNQSSSALKLFMSTDSDIIKPGKSISITISDNNTLPTPVDIPAQNNWSYPNVRTGPCQTINYGISILVRFYDKNNVTQGKILTLFDPDANCPFIQETAKVYEFQPNSGDVKQVQCKPIEGLQCYTKPYQMGQNYKFDGYWDQGIVQPFKSGIYTLVGADEWGHVAIEHFVATNSTIFTGDLGSMSCPAMFSGVQFGATIKNSIGFANYYNSTQYGYTFFLHPKMQGTISVQYKSPADAAWFQNNGNTPFNMTNGAALFYMANATNGKMITSYAVSHYNDETGHHSQICHYSIQHGGFTEPCNSDNKGDIPPSELPDASRLLHSGIITSFEPNSVMLYPNSNPVFTTSVSANSDAMPGTYWLSLQRSLCGPGVLAKLVVLP